MKLNLSQNIIQKISRIGLFTSVIVIILQFFPSEKKFKYQFEIGKPWAYELITAAYNFPIYKNDQKIAVEKAQLLKDFTPYFQLDTTIYHSEFSKFQSELTKSGSITADELRFFKSKFKTIYDRGIISTEELKLLSKDKTSAISCILPNRVTHTIEVNKLYTAITAYEEIMLNAPAKFKNLNINNYLVENIKYDKKTSELSKSEVFKGLSLTSGMVQAGQRIVDRGEIVTPQTYGQLKSFKVEYEKRNTSTQQASTVLVGEIIMILFLSGLYFMYLFLFRPRVYADISNLIFMALLMVLMVMITSIIIQFTSFSYYVVPFALLPIIVRVFFDPRTALFAHIVVMLIIAFMVDHSFQFLLLQITIGMVAVSSLRDMTQRSQLTQSALYIFISYCFMYLAFELISEGDVYRIHWQPIIYFAISSAFILLAYILIYIFEKIFGLVSSITLIELTNINSELLMEFAEIAPGTFQHSLQVSSIATEAAKKINANSLLVRTGALYHDIGKMKNPHYYTENQANGVNPLTSLDFEEAAKTIINHVKDGIEIAKANRLPDQIINFIATHHGTSKTKYFYNSFINANPNVQPNESNFAYKGPLPNNKETAILMMADAVEARSRSLTEYTEESINNMIESMVNGQIADGQFKDAPISFRDVETVKSVFKLKIKSIYHTRIVYPELNKK